MLDAIVQVFKDPIQPLPEGAAYAGLARSHKADEEDGSRPAIPCRPQRTFRLRTRASLGARRFARTLLQTAGFFLYLFCGAFSEVDFTTEAAQDYGR